MWNENIKDWINRADNPRHKKERQVIHIILKAISKINDGFQIALKGGVLIALRYGSTRHTRDIDFSTKSGYSKEVEDRFLKTLESKLLEDDHDYPIRCKVQSHEIQPPKPPQTFPTLKIKIGYADLGNRNGLKRLELKRATDTLSIDYSFNEIPIRTERIEVIGGQFVEIYDFAEIVAEKLRALIQQKDRNRTREQDIYDLNFLLNKFPVNDEAEKEDILSRLITKSRSRNLAISQKSLNDPEIKKRAERDYKQLKDTIEGELPSFDESFDLIKRFYIALPW